MQVELTKVGHARGIVEPVIVDLSASGTVGYVETTAADARRIPGTF